MRKIRLLLDGWEEEHTVYLTDREHAGLMERFNWTNIEKKGGGYEICVPCYLCRKYSPPGQDGCYGCPLALLPLGCMALVEKLTGSLIPFTGISADKLVWDKADDKSVREGLRCMTKLLQSMQCVRGRH